MTFEASLPIGTARDRYLAVNGFSLDDYDAATYEIDLGEVTGQVWTYRNSKARRLAVPFHDLHHVITDYGTDVIGEAEIGAWELMGRCPSLFLWVINVGAVVLGLLIAPRRVLRAVRTAVGQRTLYKAKVPYADVLRLTVGDVRARLGAPTTGLAVGPPRLHRRAPKQTPPQERVLFRLAMRPVVAPLITVTNRLFGGTPRDDV